MKLGRESEEVMRIDMTPLVDAIFAIILFLLVCSSYLESVEQDISIDLPTMSKRIKDRKAPTRPIVVNVRYMPGGKAYYHVENDPVSLSSLRVMLSRARLQNKDQSVVIRGDKRVVWDHIAAVMACCGQAEITKVSATVEVPD